MADISYLAMLVGYLWNWQSLFLLNPSQIFTNPSDPPVAKVLYCLYSKYISYIQSILIAYIKSIIRLQITIFKRDQNKILRQTF